MRCRGSERFSSRGHLEPPGLTGHQPGGGTVRPPRRSSARARPGPPRPAAGSRILLCPEHPLEKQAAGTCPPRRPPACSLHGARPGVPASRVPTKSPQHPERDLQVQAGTVHRHSRGPAPRDDPSGSSTTNALALGAAGEGRGSLPAPGEPQPPPGTSAAAGRRARLARSASPPAASSPPAPCCRSPRRRSCGRPCWRGRPGTPGRRRRCRLVEETQWVRGNPSQICSGSQGTSWDPPRAQGGGLVPGLNPG